MKHLTSFVLGTVLFSAAVTTNVFAQNLLPGQVDFGIFSPPGAGGEFVEVNVPGSLISLAARVVEKQEPDVAQLLNSLKLVHVNVIDMNEDNRADLEGRAQTLRKDLSGKGWERIVTAQTQGQDVGVYMKTGEKSSVQGLTVVVMDGRRQAVFINIVGDIKPEQLSKLGERLSQLGDQLNIAPLKKAGKQIEKAEEPDKE